MLKDLIQQYSIIHIAGGEYRVRYSLNAMLCLEMTYKPLEELLKTHYTEWTFEDVIQLTHAGMCCQPHNFRAVNRRDFANVRPTVAELGELISPQDIPLLKVELISAVIDALPPVVNKEYTPETVSRAYDDSHTRALYVDVIGCPEREFWDSTHKEISKRIESYQQVKGEKEVPVKVKRYGVKRQGEESI